MPYAANDLSDLGADVTHPHRFEPSQSSKNLERTSRQQDRRTAAAAKQPSRTVCLRSFSTRPRRVTHAEQLYIATNLRRRRCETFADGLKLRCRSVCSRSTRNLSPNLEAASVDPLPLLQT